MYGTHAARPQVSELINSIKLTDSDRLRLVMLFALRYERDGRPQISSLIQRCQDLGMSAQQTGAVRSLLLHAGDEQCVFQGFSYLCRVECLTQCVALWAYTLIMSQGH